MAPAPGALSEHSMPHPKGWKRLKTMSFSSNEHLSVETLQCRPHQDRAHGTHPLCINSVPTGGAVILTKRGRRLDGFPPAPLP